MDSIQKIQENLISVIIPVYNAEKYLDRCLTSILNSTWKNLEIICVDDGSTDSSREILHRFATHDARIIVVIQENGGVSVARNHGLEIAKGEYVSFVDADDWVHESFFEQLLSCAVKLDTELVCCDYAKVENQEQVFEFDSANKLKKAQENLSATAVINNFQLRSKCWGKLYRKSLVEGLAFPKGVVYGEDTIFVLDCLQKVRGEIPVVRCPLYYYYDHPESAIHTLDESELLHTVDYYISLQNYPNQELLKLYAFDGMKKMLVLRYEHQIRDQFPKARMVPYNIRMRRLLGMLRSSGFGRSPEYLLYVMFFRLPLFYRLFRILKDPSMLQYERVYRERLQ